MRRLVALVPLLIACSSSPKTVREYVARGDLFDACVEARERRADDRDPARRVVLGDALEASGRVSVSARPLSSDEVKERLGVSVLDASRAELWVLRFEHDLPASQEVARLGLELHAGGRRGTLSVTPQDRGAATGAVAALPEPKLPEIPALYVAAPEPSPEVLVPKPWEKDEGSKKPKRPKKPTKAQEETWEREVELAKKEHAEAEEAKVEASKKAVEAALAERARSVDANEAEKQRRAAATTALVGLVREAQCPRDDEGFPVLRGRGVCEVVRIVSWVPEATKAVSAVLTVARRLSSGVQICEAVGDRVLEASGDEGLEKLLGQSRATTDFRAER